MSIGGGGTSNTGDSKVVSYDYGTDDK